MSKIKLLVVAGPTASGKSDLAIRLARTYNGEIISADSRQVYRGMDIGTGKVRRDRTFPNDKYQMTNDKFFYSEKIRHHLLDVASPNRQYTVVKFKKAAERAVADIIRRGKLPILCGGSGFWIDALVYDKSLPAVKPNAKLRSQLQHFTTSELISRLSKLDPARAATIDRHNSVRLIRALEIVMSTGHPVPPRLNGSPMSRLILGISLPKATLARRIAHRLDSRLKHGMAAEVRGLHAGGVSWKRLESFGLEYRWLARYLSRSARSRVAGQMKISRQKMRDGLLRDIIAYSKRQMTWFRRNKDIVWITGSISLTTRSQNEADGLVQKFLETN